MGVDLVGMLGGGVPAYWARRARRLGEPDKFGLPLANSLAVSLELAMSTGREGEDLLGEGEDMVVVEEQETEPNRHQCGGPRACCCKRQRFDSFPPRSVARARQPADLHGSESVDTKVKTAKPACYSKRASRDASPLAKMAPRA